MQGRWARVPTMELRGSCNGCGACCKVLVLEQSPEEVRQMAALTRVLGIPSDHIFAAEHWRPLTREEATALDPFYPGRLPAGAKPESRNVLAQQEVARMDYRGLITVVTGASTGIGRETALELARRGATVIGIARSAENLARLGESARGLSGTMETARADVSDA